MLNSELGITTNTNSISVSGEPSSRAHVLDLSNRRMTSDQLVQLIVAGQENELLNGKNVQVLDLSNNELTFIPNLVLDNFPNIHTLDISQNCINVTNEFIFNVLGQFTKLEHVRLDLETPDTDNENRSDNLALQVKRTCLQTSIPTLKTVNGEQLIVGGEVSDNHQEMVEKEEEEKPAILFYSIDDIIEHVFQYYLHLKQELSQFQQEKSSAPIENDDSDFDQLDNEYHSVIRKSLLKHLPHCRSVHQCKSMVRQAKFHLFSTFMKQAMKTLAKRNEENIELLNSIENTCESQFYSLFSQKYDVCFSLPGDNEENIHEDEAMMTLVTTPDLTRHDDDSIILEMDRRSRRRGGEFSFNSPPTSTSTVETIVDAPPPYYIRFYRTICKFIPILHWLPSYRHRWWDLKNDVLAGLTVGVMLIPQSMAYSLIVGLPPVYGLYTALLPLIIYSILGTSNQLAVGPTAITSLMVASSLNTLVQSNTMPEQISVTELYIAFALVLSVLCGSVQLLLGVCRLGFLVNFLSHPVLSGFTSAAAIIIAVSQLGHFFGVSSLMTNSQGQVYEIVWSMIKLVPQFHYPTILLGVGCLGILVFLDRFRLTLNRTSLRFKLLGREFNLGNRFSFKQYPAALIIVIISVLAVFIASKADVNNGGEKQVFGIRIVGHVPSKLPAPHIPRIPARGTLRKQLLKEMILLSFPVALVAFMESISISKFYALQRGYDIDPNQELIASGVANLLGGFFQAFPASGSISRTAVNANANAVTPLSGIISFLLVLLTLLLLTPLFYYLPMAALAAIIIYSCFKIPDIDEAVFTFKTKKRDFLLMILTFLCTLFVGIMQGILIGAAASLALVIYRSSKPRFRLLGRQPGTNMYRECKKATGTATTPSSTVIQYPGIVIARFEADIYFANMSFFKDRIKRFIKRAKQPVHIFILDCSSINQVDSTAIEAIKELQPILAKMDIELYMAQLKPTIREVMDRGGAIRYIDEFFDDLHCAVVSAERKLCSKSQVAPTTTALTQTQSQNQSDTVVPSISTASSGDHAINPEGNVDKVENRDQTEIEMRDLSRLQQQQNASFS